MRFGLAEIMGVKCALARGWRTIHRREVYTPGHLAAAQYPRMLARKPLKAAVANEEAGRWQVVGGAVGAGGSIF